MMRTRTWLWLALGFLLCAGLSAQDARPDGGRGGRRPPKGPEGAVFHTEVPDHSGSVVLGRPTANSITISLLLNKGGEGVLVLGTDPARLPAAGRRVSLTAGEPKHLLIDGLTPDTRYAYALLDASTRKQLLPETAPGSFRTARPQGKAFTFTLQADSHLDGGCSPEMYRRTLGNVLADAPDFHIDLGDTFMTDKHASRESAAAQYLSQRYHLGMVAHSVPLFMVLGNHDGESLDRRGQVPAEGLALWSHRLRTRTFPNPVPDGFYSGNEARHPQAGLLENFYAWTWGDALFVVLDPYWTSQSTRGGREPWNSTLGAAQHDWLERTLRNSKARYKFVFIHQLTGSYHNAGRGGAEAAAYQEWGGLDLDGTEAFARHRPGWNLPVHRLLVETGVTVVFHGHDHFYARQELDGIVYQLVPQPSRRNERGTHAEEYGYMTGEFLPSSGHLRVKVTPEQATVDYVRASVGEGEQGGVRNGSVAASYRLVPRNAVPAKAGH